MKLEDMPYCRKLRGNQLQTVQGDVLCGERSIALCTATGKAFVFSQPSRIYCPDAVPDFG